MSAITVEQMRSKLLTVEQAQQRLSLTEPLNRAMFTVGDSVRFEAQADFNHGLSAKVGNEPVGVWVTLNRKDRYQLTRDALEETCQGFGFRREYTRDCPADLLVPHMNYWYREGMFSARKGKDFQFMVNGGLAAAFTKQGSAPFSNLALLDQALSSIEAKYGSVEVLVDHKFSHNLRRTRMRLVIPNAHQVLADTGTAGDVWSRGVQVDNSLTGTTQTKIEGYLFRWVCTNGQIDAQATTGVWTRRRDTSEAEVYDWARQAVDEALSGLDGAFDAVQRLTTIGIDGNLSDTLRDIFEHHRIPIQQRSKIISVLETYEGEITMYVIMNAITQVANEEGMDPAAVDALLRVGGDMPYTADQRCGACHRLLHSH